jgi:PAS domain S-box-containing protein
VARPVFCRNLSELVEKAKGAGALIASEEAVLEQPRMIAGALQDMPSWSELPILLLTNAAADAKETDQCVQELGGKTSVVLLQRPLTPLVLRSALQAALRARDRQFELRDRLAELHASEEKLRNKIQQLQETTTKLRASQEELIEGRKRLASARSTIEAERRRYRNFFEGAPDGNLVTDSDSIILESTRAASKLLGKQEPVGSSLAQYIDEEQREIFLSTMTGLLTETGPIFLEFRISPNNGAAFDTAMTASVQETGDGDSPRIRWAIRNITSRKRMESDLLRLNSRLEDEVQTRTQDLRHAIERLESEINRREVAESELRERSNLLEAFFQLTSTPLLFMDKSFELVRVNRAFAEITGKDPDYFTGRSFFECFPDCQNRTVSEEVLRTKKPYQAYARPYVFRQAPQEGTRYWNWWLAPLVGKEGEIESLVLKLEDVTERQKALFELKNRATQLQKLSLELSKAEDRERHRLSEILYDDLQQVLVAAKFHLAKCSRIVKSRENRCICAIRSVFSPDPLSQKSRVTADVYPSLLIYKFA